MTPSPGNGILRDVIAAMLVAVNKRVLISFFCLWFQHGRHACIRLHIFLGMIATQKFNGLQ
jgi:hypothetical protein